MSLDIRTMHMIMGVTCFIVAGAFLFFESRQFRTGGVWEWSAGYAFQGGFWIFIGLRGLIPDFLSIIVANTFLTANYSLLYAAVREFQHRSYRRDILFLPIIVTFIFISFFSAYIDNFFLRTVYVSVISAVQMSAIASILFREGPFHLYRSQWLTGCFFAAGATLWSIRLVGRSIYQPQFWEPSIVLTALLLLGFGVVVLTSFGFMLMIRERAGEALREGEERYRHLVQHAPTGIYEIDYATGRFTEVNDAMCLTLGYTRDEILAMTAFDIVDDEGKALFASRIQPGWSGEGLSEVVEYPVRTKDGRLIWALLNIMLHRINGKVTKATVVAHDITERKRAEEQLRITLESIGDGFFACDADWRFVYVNTPAESMLGIRREEVLGKSHWEVFPMTLGTNLEGEYRRAAAGEMRDFENFYESWGRWFHNRCFPREGGGMSVYFEDITMRKQAEMALNERTRQLEEANKELESFAYSVSHDLRAPLRAIDGYARMILKKEGDKFDTDTTRKFNDIRSNAQTMGQLIDDILTLARLGRAKMSVVGLEMDEIIKEVWKELQTINPERNMALTIQAMPSGRGDRTLVKQVYANLLGNAVKFTKYKNPAQIEAGGYTDGNEHVYYIKDNGVGFDMTYYDKLFGIFQRLHNNPDFEGTGVGLATIQRAIHRHGGRVWAEGKVDDGATFYFTLPRVGDRLVLLGQIT